MNAELQKVEKLGGEGLMLRQPGSKCALLPSDICFLHCLVDRDGGGCRYENGRSWSLLKVKTFHDAEALVVGHETGKGRHGDRMGALYVRGVRGRGPAFSMWFL